MGSRSTQRSTTNSSYAGWALYPGSFDPVTYGHIDLVRRALRPFRGIVVAVANNPEKQPLFSIQERVRLLRRAFRSMRRVEVETFDTLMVRYAQKRGIDTVLRGARMVSDFEYEFQLALTNRKLNPKIEMVYLMPSERYAFFSSKLIKEVAALGADVSTFVPAFVVRALRQRQRERS